MRFNKILFSLTGLTTLSLTIPGIEPVDNCNSLVTLSKFTGLENLTFPIKYSGKFFSSNKTTFNLYNASTTAKLYTKTYNSSFTGEVNLDLPIKGRLKTAGLKIEILTYLNSTLKHSCSGVIYPYKKEYFNINAYRNETIEIKGNYLSLNNYQFFTDESYDFTEINDYLSVKTNSILDLSNIYFKYTGFGEYTSGDIYLNIRDYKNVFPHLNKVNDVISLKMNKVVENNLVTLYLDEEMYVKEDTLEMYSSNNPHTTLTKDLYIPSGKEEELVDDDIYISISNSGYSGSEFTIPFSFYYINKYFGECYESDYCIFGGVKQ